MDDTPLRGIPARYYIYEDLLGRDFVLTVFNSNSVRWSSMFTILRYNGERGNSRFGRIGTASSQPSLTCWKEMTSRRVSDGALVF